MRRDLFRLLTIPGLDINELDSTALCNLHSFGSPDLNVTENSMIIEAITAFIVAIQFLMECLGTDLFSYPFKTQHGSLAPSSQLNYEVCKSDRTPKPKVEIV